MKQIDIKILDPRLNEDQYRLGYATAGSAGIDLRACVSHKLWLRSGQINLIPSGISIHLNNPCYAAIVMARSGLGVKHGIVIAQGNGLIDSDYQGQIMIPLLNRETNDFMIEPMSRIAQLVIIPVLQAQFNIVESFEQTERGANGFGSTGL